MPDTAEHGESSQSVETGDHRLQLPEESCRSEVPVATAVDEDRILQQAHYQVIQEAAHAEEVVMERRRLYVSLCIVALGAIGLAVGLGIGLSRRQNNWSANPAVELPTDSPTITRRELLRQVLERVSGADMLADEESPRFQALNWLANEDPAILPTDSDKQKIVERYIVALVYFNNNGSSWEEQTNWLSRFPVCEWHRYTMGVICNDDGYIIGLRLGDLSGTIVRELGHLSQLQFLDLAHNQGGLHGTIPTELGMLTTLTSLRLDEIGKITGKIPTEIGRLTALKTLRLLFNELTGRIPTTIGFLTNLEDFSIWENMLSGEIPSEIANLSKLDSLSLYDNALTGTIPLPLTTMTNLRSFYLHENALRGSIPSQIGRLTSVWNLVLASNKLTGSIPSEIGYFKRLWRIELNNNELTSSLPTELGLLNRTSFLYLESNRLQGSVPTELAAIGALEKIFLHNNKLTGSLPTEFHSLDKLKAVRLQQNQFVGDLDPAFCNRMIPLEELWADCAGDNPEVTCSCFTRCYKD